MSDEFITVQVRMMQVRCRLNGAETTLFTDGKLYDVTRTEGRGNALVILDDKGHERVVIADQPCPHLNHYWKDQHWPYNHQKPVGIFETFPPVVATIRVVWSPPDPNPLPTDPRVDSGGYVYQILRGDDKLVGGSYSTHDELAVWRRAFKIAREKGFTHYVTYGTNDEPKVIPVAN